MVGNYRYYYTVSHSVNQPSFTKLEIKVAMRPSSQHAVYGEAFSEQYREAWSPGLKPHTAVLMKKCLGQCL